VRTYFECLPCFVRQALDAARLAGLSEDQTTILMRRVLAEMARLSYESPPPVMAGRIHELVRAACPDVSDPYATVKVEYNRRALALLPELRALVRDAKNPLAAAVRLAVVGNVIDFGLLRPDADIDLHRYIHEALAVPLGVDHLDDLRERLGRGRRILYIGDNAGEIVFDRVLVERLAQAGPVAFAVRGRPIINDVTVEDARAVGMDRVAAIVDSGSSLPGVDFDRATPEFRQAYAEADLVVAKGQGNYETLSTDSHPGLFFLLKAKCPVIARDIGCRKGDMVVLANSRRLQAQESGTPTGGT